MRNYHLYKNYVCPNCFEQIDKCKCKSLPWNLIQIDIGIQETVRELNKKGYRTVYCCESHYDTSLSIYVLFDKRYSFKALPKGFKISNFRGLPKVEHIIKNNDDKKSFNEEKVKYLKHFTDWAKSL